MSGADPEIRETGLPCTVWVIFCSEGVGAGWAYEQFQSLDTESKGYCFASLLTGSVLLSPPDPAALPAGDVGRGKAGASL